MYYLVVIRFIFFDFFYWVFYIYVFLVFCGTFFYLFYVNFDILEFHYECDCGSKGSLLINFDDSLSNEIKSEKDLITIKNRLCCSSDESPLITILDQKLKSYELEIVCKSCGKLYKKEGRRK